MKLNNTKLLDLGYKLKNLPVDKIVQWGGGKTDSEGVMTMPYPIYATEVDAFFEEASKEEWTDYKYDPVGVGKKIKKVGYIANASLPEIKSVLTWCVRGERFSSGHWGSVIKDGTVYRVLDRIKILS